MRHVWDAVILCSALAVGARAKCYDPWPAFPPPTKDPGNNILTKTFDAIRDSVEDVFQDNSWPTTSVSIQVTSELETIWSYYHTAEERNDTSPGVEVVDGDSQYRIASITKIFTTLAILYQAKVGNLSLSDPVSHYVPELAAPQPGSIPWHDISLRILASQLSGIPRDFAQSDIIDELEDPTSIGLPPASKKDLIHCGPCRREDFLDWLRRAEPVFAPNAKSTYSNLNFNLLGLVVQNATGLPYSDYIKSAIFDPLGMTGTSLDKPDGTHAVLPKGENYWDVEQGVQRPAGGIYASANDMSSFVRYVLTHFNALATGVNWFQPQSFGTGMNSFYGMPWEIHRTDKILPLSRRPVTFFTKSGVVPGYFSIIMMIPDYGVGITILVGGEPDVLDIVEEKVAVPLVRGLERLAWEQLAQSHAGVYKTVDKHLNSSMIIESDPRTGLSLKSFVSNGSDVLNGPLPAFSLPGIANDKQAWHAQLVPTLLYKDEQMQDGEIWRLLVVPERSKEDEDSILNDFCVTDVDQAVYAGLPVNEVVFWKQAGRGIQMPAWRLEMEKVSSNEDAEKLLVQQEL